jgi:hypothetical protein
MVYGPGAYRFGDFWKLGLFVMVWTLIVTVVVIPLYWKFGRGGAVKNGVTTAVPEQRICHTAESASPRSGVGHFPRTRTENATMPQLVSCTWAAPAVLIPAILLGACAQTPMGPTVQVLPGPNKSLADFQNDQAICRQFGQQAVNDQARGANLRGLAVAGLTTALGAGLGGAIGGGSGAGIGAAAGALGGAGLAGAQTSRAQNSIQAQFDAAFAQCMFSLGNSVPSMGPMTTRPQPPSPR